MVERPTMHYAKTRNLCQDIGNGKKRYDFQTIFSPFSTGYLGMRGKCLGCRICYMHHTSGGIGSVPRSFEELYPKLKASVNTGRTELITDLIDPFLNVEVGNLILRISTAMPSAKFNFITKLPEIAEEMLRRHVKEFEGVPYHIQVTTMKDGLPIRDIVKKTGSLLSIAKSVSCRLDPFVFGISSIDVLLEQIQELAGIGVKRITTNTMKLHKGHEKLLPEIDLSTYSDGDKAGTVRIVNAKTEYNYFETISDQCRRFNIGLGVCMSRPQVRVFETAPCEGIELNEYK